MRKNRKIDILEKNRTIVKEGNTTKYIIRKIDNYKEKFVYLFFKRLFDFIFSLIISILLLPTFIVVAILIKIDSKGPILYKQERLGKNGKKFYLYKFRSMKIDAEKNGAKWADVNDERCTKIGRKIRLLRIDELPQIPFNILVGNLSFIGPRPERECFYNKFSEYIEGFEQRLLVKPGLTGLAQVSGGYNLKPEEKIVYDIEYIEKQGIFCDIKIIFRTVFVVFKHNGAR